MNLYESKIAQDEAEFEAYLDILKSETIGSYLEIGSQYGGSLWRVSDVLRPGARIVSVDTLRSKTRDSLQSCVDALVSKGHDARVILGDSTNETVIEQVRRLGPYDAVFIDANHTLPFVRKDWINYGPMGRIIAFHDISWRRAPEWKGARIDVPEFWNSIKGSYRHQELKFCRTGKNNGIGVLWRDDSVRFMASPGEMI